MVLYPDIFLRRQLAAGVAGVDRSGRFDEQRPAFLFGARPVLDSLRNDDHLPGAQHDGAVAEVDGHLAVQHDEDLAGVGMLVPDELALQLGQLEVKLVHLGHELRGPLFRRNRQCWFTCIWLRHSEFVSFVYADPMIIRIIQSYTIDRHSTFYD